MNKLIACLLLTGLLAAGCAEQSGSDAAGGAPRSSRLKPPTHISVAGAAGKTGQPKSWHQSFREWWDNLWGIKKKDESVKVTRFSKYPYRPVTPAMKPRKGDAGD